MNCFIFEGLSDGEISQIKSELGTSEQIRKGGELYKNGFIGILESGSATVKRITGTGSSITMRSILPGELFGIVSIFGDWKDGLSSIIAKDDCAVYYLTETDFEKIIKNFSVVSGNYIKYLTDRLRFLNRRIDTLSADSTAQRLYEFLLSQSDESGAVNLGYGMSELARRLKIGRSSLYRDIESLEESGLIKRENRNFILKK